MPELALQRTSQYLLKFTSISSYLVNSHAPPLADISSFLYYLWAQGSGPLLILHMVTYSAFQLCVGYYLAPYMADSYIWLYEPLVRAELPLA